MLNRDRGHPSVYFFSFLDDFLLASLLSSSSLIALSVSVAALVLSASLVFSASNGLTFLLFFLGCLLASLLPELIALSLLSVLVLSASCSVLTCDLMSSNAA